MDPRTVDMLKNRLIEERERLIEQVDVISSDYGLGEPLTDSIGDLSSYDNHPADHGSETFERSKDLALRDAARIQLAQVNDALGRIESGIYGHCAKCGKDIGEDRLLAVPHTSLCMECKIDDEDWKDRFDRPIEEKSLKYPFGRTFRDDPDNNAFDGEDAWEAVARYGTSTMDGSEDDFHTLRYGDMHEASYTGTHYTFDPNQIIDEEDNDDLPPDPFDMADF